MRLGRFFILFTLSLFLLAMDWNVDPEQGDEACDPEWEDCEYFGEEGEVDDYEDEADQGDEEAWEAEEGDAVEQEVYSIILFQTDEDNSSSDNSSEEDSSSSDSSSTEPTPEEFDCGLNQGPIPDGGRSVLYGLFMIALWGVLRRRVSEY